MELSATAINSARTVETGTVSTQRMMVLYSVSVNFLYSSTRVKLPRPHLKVAPEAAFRPL